MISFPFQPSVRKPNGRFHLISDLRQKSKKFAYPSLIIQPRSLLDFHCKQTPIDELSLVPGLSLPLALLHTRHCRGRASQPHPRKPLSLSPSAAAVHLAARQLIPPKRRSARYWLAQKRRPRPHVREKPRPPRAPAAQTKRERESCLPLSLPPAKKYTRSRDPNISG